MSKSMLIPAYAAHSAACLGCLQSLIGVGALLRPSFALQLLGFPNAISSSDRKLVRGLVQRFAIRDIALGLSVLTVWYQGCRRNVSSGGFMTLGTIILTNSILTITDGFVSRTVIGGGEWNHWGLTPINLGLGLALMGWI